jgi:hypothetical protein
MVHFNQPTERSTSSSVAARRPKATGSSDQTQGRSGTSLQEIWVYMIDRFRHVNYDFHHKKHFKTKIGSS